MASQEYLLVFLLTTLVLTAACGGGSSSMMAPPPVFTSTPGTSASQGAAYGYTVTATDPAGGSVMFALSSAPPGATFSGSTLAWTPAAAQARIADNFTITATTSEGGSATQSWSVTPSGTISGSWIDTRWTASGSTNAPFDWTNPHSAPPQALVPQSNGGFVTVQGSGNSDGTFSIPAVPRGYYWLQIGRNGFWTSSSTFDHGSDIVGRQIATIPNPETTTFAFNITGLDPVVSADQFAFLTDWGVSFAFLNIGFPIPSLLGSTTMTTSYTAPKSNIDYSSASMGFLLQYEPVSAGSITGIALGPELTLSSLSLTSGATNNVTGMLNPSPQSSFDLSVKGSQWAPLFQNAGPDTVTPVDAYISMSARPFAPKSVLGGPLNLPLFLPPLTASNCCFAIFGWPTAGTCGDGVQIDPLFTITSYPPILTDQDFGTLPYGDPFDTSWARTFSLCQKGSVQVPQPSGTAATFLFTDGVNTTIPTTPVSPLALPVQNPMLNGASLFAANTVSPSGVTLSWSAPSSGAAPYAYKATLFQWTTLPDGSMRYAESGAFYTGKTTMTLPPLQPSTTYVIMLTTEVDGRANVETSPRRSSLPTAVASVISAPITTGAQ